METLNPEREQPKTEVGVQCGLNIQRMLSSYIKNKLETATDVCKYIMYFCYCQHELCVCE